MARGRALCRTLLVVAVVAMASACAGGGDEGDAARVTYRSPVYGYAVAHPPTWSSVDAQRALAADELPKTANGATDILGEDASTRVSTMTLPGVIIAAQPVGADVDIDDWETAMIETVAAMKECDAPSRRDDVDIGGEAGVVLTYPECPVDLGYLHLWAGVVHDGLGYHVVWFDQPGNEDEDRAEFEALLSSFSFGGTGS